MAAFRHHFELQGITATGKEIGRGAYAVVEEFNFRGLLCVGKSLHPELEPGQQGNMLERFEGECEILSQLHHPNIVQFLGIHRKNESQLPVLIMERMYCTLSSCIDDHGILPDESNYSILHNVALGLNYLHHYFPNPIVHRDLSANNVLLTSDLSAKISDLGVAKILNQPMSKMTACPGTPPYMPPEVFLDGPKYSTKVDNFSYGVLMLHMFCGKWPFPLADRYEDPHDRNKYILRTEIERRQQFFSDIQATHPLLPLMRRCLSDHPDARPTVLVILTAVRKLNSQFPPSFQDRVKVFEQIKADANEKAILNERVSSLLTEVKQREHQNELQAAEIDSLNDELGRKIAQLDANDSTIAELNRQLAVKDILLKDKESVIANRDEQIQLNDCTIDSLKYQLASLTSEVADLSQKVQELSNENTTLSVEKQKLLPISEVGINLVLFFIPPYFFVNIHRRTIVSTRLLVLALLSVGYRSRESVLHIYIHYAPMLKCLSFYYRTVTHYCIMHPRKAMAKLSSFCSAKELTPTFKRR